MCLGRNARRVGRSKFNVCLWIGTHIKLIRVSLMLVRSFVFTALLLLLFRWHFEYGRSKNPFVSYMFALVLSEQQNWIEQTFYFYLNKKPRFNIVSYSLVECDRWCVAWLWLFICECMGVSCVINSYFDDDDDDRSFRFSIFTFFVLKIFSHFSPAIETIYYPAIIRAAYEIPSAKSAHTNTPILWGEKKVNRLKIHLIETHKGGQAVITTRITQRKCTVFVISVSCVWFFFFTLSFDWIERHFLQNTETQK